MQPISGHQTGTPVALAREGLEGVRKEHLRQHIHSQTINTSLFKRCIRSAAWAADISCMRKVWHRLAKSGMGLGYHNSTHPSLLCHRSNSWPLQRTTTISLFGLTTFAKVCRILFSRSSYMQTGKTTVGMLQPPAPHVPWMGMLLQPCVQPLHISLSF